MRITICIIYAALALTLLAAPAARADRRSFIRAYEYQTQPKGNLEFELWNDIAAPRSKFADSVITHKLELEYGVTDHFDVSLYHVFEHGGPASDPDSSFHFDSWRLETRYRLAERGEWPVDVLLYFEIERPNNLTEPFETEEKLVLERSFGKLAFVGNLVGEQKLMNAGEGRRWEVDLGARYEVAPQLRLAAEFWTNHKYEDRGKNVTRSYFLGPSISVASEKLWLQLGVGFGLTDASQQMQVRSVLGFNL